MYCTSWFFYWSKWLACKKIRNKNIYQNFSFNLDTNHNSLLVWNSDSQVCFGVDVKPQTVWGLDLSVIFPYSHCVSLELAREKYVLSYIAGALGHWEQLRTRRATVLEFSALILQISLANMWYANHAGIKKSNMRSWNKFFKKDFMKISDEIYLWQNLFDLKIKLHQQTNHHIYVPWHWFIAEP